ncbi:MAG: ABC transporter ATP-binding protein [Acidimicrobiia bacterium]
MAWGGGGGMFGAGGGGMFGGQQNGRSAGNPGNGLPFAGIPSEMLAGVKKVLAREPDWEPPEVTFTHQMVETKRLTLRNMLAEQRGALWICLIIVIVEATTLQAGPYLARIGIDDGMSAGNWGVVLATSLAGIGAVLVTGLTSGLRVAYTGRLAARVMFNLRVRVFSHLQRMSLDYYTDEKAGVIMTRMTSDIESMQQLLQDGLIQFALQGLTMVIVTIVLFTYNVELALITIGIVVPILFALSLWFRAASERGYTRVRDGIAGVLSDLSESLQGVRLVTGFNRQRHNVLHHRDVVGTYRDANDYTAFVQAVYGPGTEFIGLAGQVAILFIGGHMVTRSQLSVGELVAFVLYLNAFFQPIQQLVTLYNTYQQGRAAIVKLGTLLLTTPAVPEASDAYDLPAIDGEIVVDHVSFGYNPTKLVLHDVSLHIAPGETISFVGPTGAGKSTVAKLVTRFYDPTDGAVRIDGHDLRKVTIKSLRRQIGVVPQEPFLFVGTIRDNISFARPEATDDEVDEAVRRVGLSDLIGRLPDGLDTEVHERGVSLSSGERQLLALARAFLAQPRVLVLDEATSNLDLQSETLVEAGLDAVLEGRTAIIVAHRLSTAMRADRIVVVDGGRIAEVGPHAELIAKGGRYAEMFAAWEAHMSGTGTHS